MFKAILGKWSNTNLYRTKSKLQKDAAQFVEETADCRKRIKASLSKKTYDNAKHLLKDVMTDDISNAEFEKKFVRSIADVYEED